MAAKKSYSVEDLRNAVAETQAGEASSMRAVAHKYGVPHSTLNDHLKGKYKKIGAGGPTVLTASEEREIALTCSALADMGFGLTRDLVQVVIHAYLQDHDIPNPFTGGVPGKDWWQRFMRWWPSLSERKPQHLSTKRAQAADGEIVYAWFDKVEAVLSSAGLNPSDPAIKPRLWNCDETAFCTSASTSKLIVRRGAKMCHEIGGGSGREYITVHCAGSAAGERLPRFIVDKGKNLHRRWMVGGPAAAILWGVRLWLDGCEQFSVVVHEVVCTSNVTPHREFTGSVVSGWAHQKSM